MTKDDSRKDPSEIKYLIRHLLETQNQESKWSFLLCVLCLFFSTTPIRIIHRLTRTHKTRYPLDLMKHALLHNYFLHQHQFIFAYISSIFLDILCIGISCFPIERTSNLLFIYAVYLQLEGNDRHGYKCGYCYHISYPYVTQTDPATPRLNITRATAY